MTKQSFFLLLSLSILFFACKNTDSSDALTNSNQVMQTLEHDGVTREYIVYVPDSYDPGSKVPLLFNFHGFGGDAKEFMQYADMRATSESGNFILVYPQGTLINGFSHWNAALNSPDNKSNADDLGFMEALISKLSSDYMIDPERIYACGYSNGGMFSYALACYHSDLIAAVGAVSGTMLDLDCTPSHPMPVIILHGTSDDVLPYNGSDDYNSVEAILNFWNDFNNTGTSPVENSVDDNGTTIEHYRYTHKNNEVSVEHYKIIGGDHLWFDLNYQGSNTGELIWNFVSGYTINDE